MSDITITRPAQAALLLALVGAIGAIVAAQLPELKRYLKIRSM
ncbi:MAG TPA: hypothetical protein VIJ33_04535 [Solirubrobacteraceae bacterium]|jgi:hypothetical protein